MTDAVKLLTEAEAQGAWSATYSTHAKSFAEYLADLSERGLFAPEPTCPLLEEAREIAAKACEDNGHPETGEYMRSVDPANSTTLAAALAALKRGMEMRPPLTREMVREVEDQIALAILHADTSERLWRGDLRNTIFHFLAPLTKDQS